MLFNYDTIEAISMSKITGEIILHLYNKSDVYFSSKTKKTNIIHDIMKAKLKNNEKI